MIAKDEEATIGRAILSIFDHVDSVCMDLSGTTDDTRGVAERHLIGKTQHYFDDDWKGAANAYNKCLEWLENDGCDWIIRLDADTVFEFEDQRSMKERLTDVDDEIDGIKIPLWEFGRFVSNRVWITKPHCRYYGIRHEGMFCDNPQSILDGILINHFDDSGARPRVAETYLGDAKAILSDLKSFSFDQDQGTGETADRMISRYAFYLANSYRDGGDVENSLAWYRARSLMGAYHEEVELCLIHIARITQDRGDIRRMLEKCPFRADSTHVAIDNAIRSNDQEWMKEIWEIVNTRHHQKGRMFCGDRVIHDALVMKERLRSIIMADDGIKKFPAWLMWESAIDEETCDRWIKIGKDQEAQAASIFRDTLEEDNDGTRKTQVRWIYESGEGNDILRELGEYLGMSAERMGVGVEYLPPIQFTEYADVGHHYDTHHDIDWNRQDGRHRKISIVVNLSDPSEYTGGQFNFLSTDHPDPIALSKRGTVLCFLSYQEHKVTPIESGQRTSLVAWAEGERWQ